MSTIATAPAPQVALDALALNLAKKRAALADASAAYDAEIVAVHHRHRRLIVEAAGAVAGAEDALRVKIEQHHDLFQEPKSWTLHGIQFGLKKGAGRLEWDDAEDVVARIEKLFPEDEAELLIRTKREPISAALEDLDAKILARLGVRVEGTGDVVFVRPVETGFEKILKLLLKQGARIEPKAEKPKAKKGAKKK